MNKKQLNTKYKCSECGIATVVIEGQIIRPCNHNTAAVIADISATAYGVSHFNKDEVK